MYEFKMTFAGESPAVASDTPEHGAALERIGREIVDLLRQQGFLVRLASLSGHSPADLLAGTVRSAPVVNEDITKDVRKPTVKPSGRG